MDEYIKREEAIKIAESYKPQNGSSFCRNRGIADYIAEDISMIPSADVAPVRHGRWKCHGDCGVTECSVCGWSIEEYVGDYAYCHNCGARMDGGAD